MGFDQDIFKAIGEWACMVPLVYDSRGDIVYTVFIERIGVLEREYLRMEISHSAHSIFNIFYM